MLGNIVIPLLTYYNKSLEVDFSLILKAIVGATKQGVDSFLIGGTTGEFVHLSIEERIEILSRIRSEFGKSVKLLFNVTTMQEKQRKQLCQAAVQYEADAVSLTAPYFHRYDEEALLHYFQKACEDMEGMSIYLYNIPAMTNNPISKKLFEQLIYQDNNIIGIKDSSMDFTLIQEYELISRKRGVDVYTGNDAQLLSALQYGLKGGIIALANVFPEKCKKIYQNFMENQIAEAKKEQEILLQLRDLARSIRPIVAHKYMQELLGKDTGYIRFPMQELNALQKEKIEAVMKKLGLI